MSFFSLFTVAVLLPQTLALRLPSWSKRDDVVATASTLWVVEDIYKGDSFFDTWDFFNQSDPTHGQVTFVDQDFAFQNNLAYVSNGQATMRVDNWTTLASGQPRNAVRISSQKIYNGGLFILDVSRSPFGCGVWPAFWTLGTAQQWPYSGEIDITEGVEVDTHNQVTWHTGPGCNLTSPGNFTGTAVSTDCFGNEQGGCGIVDWSRSSYGPQFNQLGGGIYAMRWTEESIDAWFFYRATIPADITQGTPDPTLQTWGMPSASLSSQNCNLTEFFQDHQIIFDITICGDWGGAAYTQDGCPGTCSDRVMDPSNFDDAVWQINSLSVYRQSTLAGRISSGAAVNANHHSVVLATILLVLSWFLTL